MQSWGYVVDNQETPAGVCVALHTSPMTILLASDIFTMLGSSKALPHPRGQLVVEASCY